MPMPSREERLQRLLDRTEIFDLIRFERWCRDMKDWPGLVGCYVPGAPVRTTWFEGPVEAFAKASEAKMKRDSTAKHWIWPSSVRIHGDRATCESWSLLFDRLDFDGVEFDYHSYVRFYSRLVRTGEGWRMASFEGIYSRDALIPVKPGDELPIDWELAAGLRKSYRYMGYTQIKRGYTLPDDLIGDDRPDLRQAFYDEARAWLDTGA
jgi:hypothetical protein